MLRLSELKLPLDCAPDALPQLICRTLGIAPTELLDYSVFKLSFDARKAALLQVYIVDASLGAEREQSLLLQHAQDPHVRPTPDMSWHAPAQAGADLRWRPVVVGFGPCGIFAALALAQMGFKPIVLERGKKVRERTLDTWGLWRKKTLNPESNVQFGGAAPARFPTASCTARSRTRATWGAR